jgi:hypothetical protein
MFRTYLTVDLLEGDAAVVGTDEDRETSTGGPGSAQFGT